MLKLTYREKYNKANTTTEYFDDIKSLGQALIKIVNNKKEENSAMDWCERASFGDMVVRKQFGYKIECFREEDLVQYIEKTVIKPICSASCINYNFIGWDNGSLTWDIDAGISWIKFNETYGYSITINQDCQQDGLKEYFNTSTKDRKQFISSSIAKINNYNRDFRIQEPSINNKVLARVVTKNRCYEIVRHVGIKKSNYKELDVIVTGLKDKYNKRVTVYDSNGIILAEQSGLGNAPAELYEQLEIIFCNTDIK